MNNDAKSEICALLHRCGDELAQQLVADPYIQTVRSTLAEGATAEQVFEKAVELDALLRFWGLMQPREQQRTATCLGIVPSAFQEHASTIDVCKFVSAVNNDLLSDFAAMLKLSHASEASRDEVRTLVGDELMLNGVLSVLTHIQPQLMHKIADSMGIKRTTEDDDATVADWIMCEAFNLNPLMGKEVHKRGEGDDAAAAETKEEAKTTTPDEQAAPEEPAPVPTETTETVKEQPKKTEAKEEETKLAKEPASEAKESNAGSAATEPATAEPAEKPAKEQEKEQDKEDKDKDKEADEVIEKPAAKRRRRGSEVGSTTSTLKQTKRSEQKEGKPKDTADKEEEEEEEKERKSKRKSTAKQSKASKKLPPEQGYYDSDGKWVHPPFEYIMQKKYDAQGMHNNYNLTDLQDFCKEYELQVAQSAKKKSALIRVILNFVETGVKPSTPKRKSKGRSRGRTSRASKAVKEGAGAGADAAADAAADTNAEEDEEEGKEASTPLQAATE